MNSVVRLHIIGGLLFTAALCSSSTVTPRRPQSIAKVTPPIRLLGKGSANSLRTIPLNVHVMHSPILDFAPWLELHHVVFISESKSRKVYAVDYSPINQSENLLQLFLGQNVPAEIRVRLLTADNADDIEDLKKKWSCLDMASDRSHCPSVDVALRSNNELVLSQRFIKSIIENWDTSMNLYTHNCQHFSKFVKNLLNS